MAYNFVPNSKTRYPSAPWPRDGRAASSNGENRCEILMATNDNHEYLTNPLNTIHSRWRPARCRASIPACWARAPTFRPWPRPTEAYQRTKQIAGRELSGKMPTSPITPLIWGQVSVPCKLRSMALVAAIEQDKGMGRAAVELAIEQYINKPVRIGHVAFGADVAKSASSTTFATNTGPPRAQAFPRVPF